MLCRFLFTFGILMFVACASVEPPSEKPTPSLPEAIKCAAGTVASYTFTGASYGAEVLWDIAGGTVMFTALCGPVIAADIAAKQAGNRHLFRSDSGVQCLPGRIDALGAPPLGRYAFEYSKPLRCLD